MAAAATVAGALVVMLVAMFMIVVVAMAIAFVVMMVVMMGMALTVEMIVGVGMLVVMLMGVDMVVGMGHAVMGMLVGMGVLMLVGMRMIVMMVKMHGTFSFWNFSFIITAKWRLVKVFIFNKISPAGACNSCKKAV